MGQNPIPEQSRPHNRQRDGKILHDSGGGGGRVETLQEPAVARSDSGINRNGADVYTVDSVNEAHHGRRGSRNDTFEGISLT